MSFLKQAGLALVVVVVAAGLWLVYVPSARPLLARMGVYRALAVVGVSPPADAAEGPKGGGAYAGQPQTIEVVALPVTEGVMNDTATAIGNGRALRSVAVTPQVAGRLTAVNFTSGSHVTAGALLAQMDDEAQRIALEKARLVMANAERTAERTAKLGTTGAASATAIQDAQLALKQAELGVKQAHFDLAQRRITAPFSGWIGLRSAEVGDQVTPSTVLAQLDDRTSLLVDFRLPERYVAQLHPGQTLAAAPLAHPERALAGVIRALDNKVDEASRTILVEAELANPDDTLRAGMAFSIHIALKGDPFPAVAPLAIQWSSEGAYVWKVDAGKVQRVSVRILQRNADDVLVGAALKPGDVVVTEGVQMLRPGAAVQVRTSDPALQGQEGAGQPEVTQAPPAAQGSNAP